MGAVSKAPSLDAQRLMDADYGRISWFEDMAALEAVIAG